MCLEDIPVDKLSQLPLISDHGAFVGVVGKGVLVAFRVFASAPTMQNPKNKFKIHLFITAPCHRGAAFAAAAVTDNGYFHCCSPVCR